MDKESEEIGRPSSDEDPDPAELIVRGEDHLSAAVQIIDNLLQPAPEMLLAPELQQYPQKSVKSNKQLFRNTFIRSGGLPVVLRILIATPVDSNSIIDSTSLAVALHIVHFLLTSSGAPPTSSSDPDSTITDELLLQVRWSSTRCRWQASCYRSLAGQEPSKTLEWCKMPSSSSCSGGCWTSWQL